MLRVLNKDIPLQELYPLEILIRHIIDGPVDVDKGDYLPRDSYHCGVNYGVYRRWSVDRRQWSVVGRQWTEDREQKTEDRRRRRYAVIK